MRMRTIAPWLVVAVLHFHASVKPLPPPVRAEISGHYWHQGCPVPLSRLRVDAGHPHTFTPRRARALLRDHGFTTLQFEVGSYEAARREDLAAPALRARLKGHLGVSEFLVSAVARQSPAD